MSQNWAKFWINHLIKLRYGLVSVNIPPFKYEVCIFIATYLQQLHYMFTKPAKIKATDKYITIVQ